MFNAFFKVIPNFYICKANVEFTIVCFFLSCSNYRVNNIRRIYDGETTTNIPDLFMWKSSPGAFPLCG